MMRLGIFWEVETVAWGDLAIASNGATGVGINQHFAVSTRHLKTYFSTIRLRRFCRCRRSQRRPATPSTPKSSTSPSAACRCGPTRPPPSTDSRPALPHHLQRHHPPDRVEPGARIGHPGRLRKLLGLGATLHVVEHLGFGRQPIHPPARVWARRGQKSARPTVREHFVGQIVSIRGKRPEQARCGGDEKTPGQAGGRGGT